MKEVSKAAFKEAYFRLGGGKDGWTASYWEKFYEPEPKSPMKYLVEEPPSPRTRACSSTTTPPRGSTGCSS
ncbi:MAG: hypothetical protein M0D55_02795 [Elusimicrobiota bacterium]|nr:MAG: hypothetical protein M0D55_02795 [Elusimicrobiota bacterium]